MPATKAKIKIAIWLVFVCLFKLCRTHCLFYDCNSSWQRMRNDCMWNECGMFKRCPNANAWTFLQGSYPSQNNGKEKTAWGNMGAQKFTISAKSHGFNPVDHILQIVKMKLHQDALEKKIVHENFEKTLTKSFASRVKNILKPTFADVTA